MPEEFIDPFNNIWVPIEFEPKIPKEFLDPLNTKWFVDNSTKPPYLFHINKIEKLFYYTVRIYLVNNHILRKPFCLIEVKTNSNPKQTYTAKTSLNFYEINNKISELIEQIYIPISDLTELVREMKA